MYLQLFIYWTNELVKIKNLMEHFKKLRYKLNNNCVYLIFKLRDVLCDIVRI